MDLMIYNLQFLYSRIKRDPQAYKPEFLQQYEHYKATILIFHHNPTIDSHSGLCELVLFISNVANLYPETLEHFHFDIISLLDKHLHLLNPALRFTLAKCIIILRNKNIVDLLTVFQLFFKLFLVQSKPLRKLVYSHLISDIRRVNYPNLNSKLNSQLHTSLLFYINGTDATQQFLATDIAIQMIKKNIWLGEHSVYVVQLSILNPLRKISHRALKFFLSRLSNDSDSLDDLENVDDEFSNLTDVIDTNNLSKKGKKRKKQLETAKNVLNKNKDKLRPIFPALYKIRDPQDLAQKVMKRLEVCHVSFEYRLDLIEFLALIIGIHKLHILNFYSYIQKYLKTKQRNVTLILSYVAQSTHEHTPIDVLKPCVESIIDNFISERNSPEAIAVGLNTIREISNRRPHVLDEQLVQHLVEYKKYKNKNVVMAARSVLQLYRDRMPQLLARKDRGKPGHSSDYLDDEMTNLSVYQEEVFDFVPGTELLADDNYADPLECARNISQTHILSQADFYKIDKLKIEAKINPKFSNQQLQINQRQLLMEERGVVDVSDIEHLTKRQRKTKEKVSAERSEHEKPRYGQPKGRINEFASVSNKIKRKSKDFRMVKHAKSIQIKKKKSFHQKQLKLKQSLMKEIKARSLR